MWSGSKQTWTAMTCSESERAIAMLWKATLLSWSTGTMQTGWIFPGSVGTSVVCWPLASR